MGGEGERERSVKYPTEGERERRLSAGDHCRERLPPTDSDDSCCSEPGRADPKAG